MGGRGYGRGRVGEHAPWARYHGTVPYSAAQRGREEAPHLQPPLQPPTGMASIQAVEKAAAEGEGIREATRSVVLQQYSRAHKNQRRAARVGFPVACWRCGGAEAGHHTHQCRYTVASVRHRYGTVAWAAQTTRAKHGGKKASSSQVEDEL